MSGHHQHHSPPASPSVETLMSSHEMMKDKPLNPNKGHHDSHSMMNNGHMMMYFHGGFEEVILFDFWRIDSIGGLIMSMIICFLLSVSYEAIKFAREVIFRKYNAPFIEDGNNNAGSSSQSNNDDPASPKIRRALVFKNYIWSKSHFILTFLHILQVIVSYLLMLIFMTYNSWLCLSVIIGTAAGYFFFGWKRSSILDISDHCH